MDIFYILLMILLVAIAFLPLLLYLFDAKVNIVFDTDRNDMHLSACWLYPFIKVTARIKDTKPVMDLYLFKLHLINRAIKTNRDKTGIKKADLIKILKPGDLSIKTKYGFTNPSVTGIACGAINAASQFNNIDFLDQIPDFMTEHDYIYFDASATINLGAALISLIKYYKNRRDLEWIRTQA